MSDDKITDLPLAAVAAALRNSNITARALAENAIERHEQMGARLNAYLTWTPELARSAAAAADAAFAAGYDLGPMQGLPVSMKDLYGIAGLPTFAGSGMRLPPQWEQEGPVVTWLKSQLAVLPGKTQTVEFAAGGIGDNIHHGAPWNPWGGNSHRAPGGSSSGAGVSLWEGSALVAFGSDTMGSVRIPASMTGTVALKLTYGRWPNAGIVPLRAGQDTPGPLTRTVADAAYVFTAIDPAHRSDPAAALQSLASRDIAGLRIGIAGDAYWVDCDASIAECVQRGLKELEAAGAQQVDVPCSETADLLRAVFSGELPNAELLAFLRVYLPDWIDQLDPALRGRLEASTSQDSATHLEKWQWIESLIPAASSGFDNVDVIASPTLIHTPPILEDNKPVGATASLSPMWTVQNTCPANFFRWCALSMPVGLDQEGMPAGLQLMAPGGSEETLLAAALACERILGSPRQRIGAPPL